MAHLEEALDLDPGHTDALRLLGEAYRADGDLAAAERLFKDWAEYVPGSADAHLALAELLLERNDPEGAAEHYDRLVTFDPDNFDYATARTQVLLALGRYPQAVDGLVPFADAETPNPAAVLLLARVQHQAGQAEKAVERYRQFLALRPEAPQKTEVEAALAELGY
jgi:tetratricopeptide (TPR) repeat protein